MSKKKKETAIRATQKYLKVDVEKYPLILGYMLGRQEAAEEMAQEPPDPEESDQKGDENREINNHL